MWLNNIKQKRLLFYLAALIVLSCMIWLIMTVKKVSNHTTGKPQTIIDNAVTTITPSDDSPQVQADSKQAEMSLDDATVVANETVNIMPAKCSARCNSTLSMLDEDVELDDETFQNLATQTEEIAAYLRGDEGRRQYYLEMAMTTADGDKRAFLTEVFKHLPEQQKDQIAENFIGSNNWRVRADGVTLMADQGISNLDEANTLIGIFSNEENSYIKSSILNYLEQSQSLRGDVEILQQLDSALYYDTNTSVQVAALKAKMLLSDEPFHILPDALQALRASEPEFQLAGLVAIEKVLEHEKKNLDSDTFIDTHSIANEFEIIRNLAVYGEDKKRFESLIKEANTIYLRHFEN